MENQIEKRMSGNEEEHRHECTGHDYWHPANRVHKGAENLPPGHILEGGGVVPAAVEIVEPQVNVSAETTYIAKFKKDFVVLQPAKVTFVKWTFNRRTYTVQAVEPLTDDMRQELPVRYILPGEVISAPVWVQTRLQSTKGGNNASWHVSKELEGCLNGASYQPIFRGWVTKFCWAPPNNKTSQRDGTTLDIGNSPGVAQYGSLVLNWTGDFVTPPKGEVMKVDAPTRAHLRQWLLKEGMGEPRWTQGALELIRTDAFGDNMLPWGNSKAIYNHFFPTGEVIARAGNLFLIQLVGEGINPVLARDHPPLELTAGIYICRHPTPPNDGRD